MDKTTSIICRVIFAILIWCGVSFAVFLVTNWDYIFNPHQIPYYTESRSIFGHGHDDLAKYRVVCFEIPFIITSYLIVIETILVLNLRFKTTLTMTKLHYSVIVIFFLIMIFPNVFSEELEEKIQKIKDLLPFFNLIFCLYIILVSVVLLFIKRYKSYRAFLFLNIITVLIYLIFVFAYLEFFFD